MLDSNILFYLFSIILVFCAFMVIMSSHTIFSLLFLVGCFIFSAFLLFLLECEFLALLFITIYVGAIAVLFLFAIMMLESKQQNLTRNVTKYFPIGFIFGIVILLFVVKKIPGVFLNNPYNDKNNFYLNNFQNWYDLIDSTNDIEIFGQILYSYFVLQILVVGLILLVVLVGVVYLLNSFNPNKQTLEQATFKQLSRESKFFFTNQN